MFRAKASTQKKRRAAAYILRVTYQGRPANPGGLTGLKNGEFRLPLAPQNIRYEASARTATHALHGENVADEHGMNPPDITISGTFGEATRGGLDGIEWQRALEDLIEWYARVNLTDGLARRPLHELEWHDTFRGEHWVVTPKAVPYGEQDASKPVTESYTLRLEALRKVAAPPVRAAPAPLSVTSSALCPLYPGCVTGGEFDAQCPYRGQA